MTSDRFWSRVIKGPDPSDCWIWTGAIGDDGYGRFWTRTVDGGQQVLRPQRYAFEQITGRVLERSVMVLHWCDVPLCVHAEVVEATSHLREGDARGNMIDRSQRGRYAGPTTALGSVGAARRERAARSRAVRALVLERGYDAAEIRKVLAGTDEDLPALF
ncbi:hypothetical protein C5C18_11835 [Rathayibacter tritici]|uniref:hypothetical protein n=1 Tax=Rathayibacter tritici TaxID=33888 RepID=UPI000CE9082C|nr:hypothetical protein [Rathayibacter tritici]PPF28031.1 hypothetical protein C5C06_08510 [Rathayibacter tritici]PPF66166.1 hypothetical protein C5C21_09765 [Rathayibacter tritici]PPG05970.1 hypothetical protein C5C18_11835 [Rathayibacter tritici]PPI10674.1 hypothetical protein C5D07_14880 [Rathayibacter tritici]PPI47046.1 hypothetical protein C5D18_04685 [Rathayibacter tritici]